MKDVLIVEDDQQTLDALIRFLTREGHSTRGARTADSAISEIDRQSPDVLITDWDLGSDMTGIHVVIHATKRNADIQVVMVSGNHMQRLQHETKDLSIQHYISKPFSISDMRAVFEDFL